MTPPARILVTDPDVGHRDSLTGRLRAQGFEVETAENGQGALALRRAKYFDLAIVNARLPDMSAIELLPEFRGSEPPTACIVITEYWSLYTEAMLHGRGAAAYLLKPLDFNHLDDLIDRL